MLWDYHDDYWCWCLLGFMLNELSKRKKKNYRYLRRLSHTLDPLGFGAWQFDPSNRLTKLLVEASVHNFWSDSSTPRPFLKFEKKDELNLFWLPVSSPTRLVASPFCGQSARNWGRKLGLIVGSAPFPVVVKLYSLYLKNWQAEVPMVWPPSHDINE